MSQNTILQNTTSGNDEKVVRLLCINDSIIKKLVFCKDTIEYYTESFKGCGLVKGKKYTATGFSVNEQDLFCYNIKEINNGEQKLVERFREIDD